MACLHTARHGMYLSRQQGKHASYTPPQQPAVDADRASQGHSSDAADKEPPRRSFEYWATEHLYISGAYWGLHAATLMQLSDAIRGQDLKKLVLRCQQPCGGFAGNLGHDPRILHTLSAVQILLILDAYQEIKTDQVCQYVIGLQLPNGAFVGDEWGEIDTRYTYCGLATLGLLGRLHLANTSAAAAFLKSCFNPDGGFGIIPGAESHAGQTFCCVAGLLLCDALDEELARRTGEWLLQRQAPSGGLNGRPGKPVDSCYGCTWLGVFAPMLEIRRMYFTRTLPRQPSPYSALRTTGWPLFTLCIACRQVSLRGCPGTCL
eukprot:m.110466 g.110466  ORF g.110466 m.110466 type:complete len:319 (-) comp16045_c0_seq3:292-1248(-)